MASHVSHPQMVVVINANHLLRFRFSYCRHLFMLNCFLGLWNRILCFIAFECSVLGFWLVLGSLSMFRHGKWNERRLRCYIQSSRSFHRPSWRVWEQAKSWILSLFFHSIFMNQMFLVATLISWFYAVPRFCASSVHSSRSFPFLLCMEL